MSPGNRINETTERGPPDRAVSADDDDEEEEEMVSLGLSREGSMHEHEDGSVGSAPTPATRTTAGAMPPHRGALMATAAGGRGAAAAAGVVNDEGPVPAAVGTNRMSAFPATPAAGRGGGGDGGAPIRRTPGPPGMMGQQAQQRHHRLTPGAGQMQQHLDEDLGRETPVMSGGGNRHGKTPHKLSLPSSALVTPSHKPQLATSNNLVETPTVINANANNRSASRNQQLQQRQLYTPAHFTLAKNAELNMDSRPEAFSPATIRMTDSLEKLLTDADDDDYLDAKQRAWRQQQQQQTRQQQQQEDVAASDPGAFRRIQSAGSSEDGGHEFVGRTKDHVTASKNGGASSSDDEDEEEAEISRINEEDDGSDIDQEISKTDSNLSRPKPVSFESSSGGAFSKPTALKRAVPAPGIVAEGHLRGTKPVGSSLHTPKPQRTRPRPTPPQHQNQGPEGGIYYTAAQHQHHGYFGSDGVGGQYPDGLDMFYGQQSQPPHIQYPHPPQQTAQHHHQYAPSQNYHHSSMAASPRFSAVPPPVSPLTIPMDYSGVYHQPLNPYHSHHSIHPIPPGPPHGGGDWSWNMNHSMHHPHDYAQQQHRFRAQTPTFPGYASPDIFSHELSGAASPFNVPHNHHPYQHASTPSHHQQQHRQARGQSRQRTQSKEYHRSEISRSSPPLESVSPIRQHQHLSPSARRESGVGSTKSGFMGGSGRDGSAQTKSVSSPSASSTASVLRQAFPGLVHSPSSEEPQLTGPLEQRNANDWFHPSPMTIQSKNESYPSVMDNSCQQPRNTSIAATRGGYNQPLFSKGRGGKVISHEQHLPGGAMAEMQNIPGRESNNNNNSSRIKKVSGKQQQRDRNGKFQHQQHQVPPGRDKRGPASGNSNENFIIESPAERQAFKEFGRHFRQKETSSLNEAREYALSCLDPKSHPELYLPPATHWRVFLELADVAKRLNMIDDARSHYKEACRLQPRASQGWLEHSKLEEECGNLDRCASILQEGLSHCTTNENLLIRAVKFYERTDNLDQARRLLSRTKYLNIDKSWKTVLEGALLEARVGRYSMAREVLKYLTHYVPWYGPLYLAHTKLERDYGSTTEAKNIVEKGLKELPRYGPLYFQAFRLLEREDISEKNYDLPRTMVMVARADSISRELLWKVHLESAQMQERAAVVAVEDNPKQLDLRMALRPARRSYAKAVMLCPPNLTWKIWLASGRTEVSCGNTKGARDLFLRAYDCVSEKGRSTVLLECARLEEFVGDLQLSRSILCKARQQFGKSDWKVWLSSVNLECRCGLRERAIGFAQNALNIHRGTGRLWAALIQLRHDDGELQQMKVLKCALQAVPKSGEVWCEGARIHLNPFSPTFDLQAASWHLSFAARFTPQYGDSFLEQLRLNMLDQWLVSLAEPFILCMHDTLVSLCSSNPMSVDDARHFIAEHTKKASDAIKSRLKENKDAVVTRDVLDTSDLELRCSSADPNYGHLWFQCRNSPIDTAREVIHQARIVMANFVIDYSYLYVAAMVRRAGVIMLIHHQEGDKLVAEPPGQGHPQIHSHSWDRLVEAALRSVPSLDQMLAGDVTGSWFTTGCGGNRCVWEKLSLDEKRRVLFGSDSLLS